MKRDLRIALISLLFAVTFSVPSFGQERTGSIEITTKDKTGTIVPGIKITVASTGPIAGFKKIVSTDANGFVRVEGLNPGKYLLAIWANVGSSERAFFTVEVTPGQATPVDVSVGIVSDIQTRGCGARITTTYFETLPPKGLNFSSVLRVAPALRPEPRSGQFQVDGASGSENIFFIDGLEVTNVLTGRLDANSDLPFSQIQEVQVKFSGLTADVAGATGGVINVITKSGSNDFHGEFGIGLRTSRLEPIAGSRLRSNNGFPEYYPSRRDQYNETNPTATLGGPIVRDKLWFFAGYAPQKFTQSRTLIFLDGNRVPTGRVDTYHFDQRKEAAFGRIDAQVTDKLRLTGTINWNPLTQTGVTPGYSNELGSTFASPAAYVPTGGRQNSINFTGSGSYAVTNNLIVTARAGHYFLNQKLGTYGIGDISSPRYQCASLPFSTVQFPGGFGCTGAGGPPSNQLAVSNTLYDATKRDQFDSDAAYIFNGGGRHEIKGGYQYNLIGNQVLSGQNDLINLRSGSTGLATVGNYSGRSIPSTPGAIGSGRMSTVRTRGDVSSANNAVYIQDKWQPIRRLTLNLGIRAENEDVPSYAPGLSGLNFGWGSKLAPRLGAAYDLTGDGKTKVSAFYGLYYDRFKLTLPRGQFGGDEFHDIYFEWFPGDTLFGLNRETIFGPGNSPIPGGACPLGTLTPVYGRVRCDIDFRVSANSGGPLTEVGGIDPNIKPFSQREITFTFQREIARNYVFSARYTRKQVLHAIEDAGFPNSQGSEYYIIGNPGEGLHKQQADMFGLLAPKPQRQYDALEIRLDRRFADSWYFNANYTYSRLYGNYSGLASSDEEGRSDPNSTRYFDQPHAGFTAAGGPDNGRLATDRPHVFKAFGAYSLGWEKLGLWESNSTDFSVFTTAQSGTPITSFVDINNVSQIVLTKRGDQGRTPIFTQTDLAVHHNIRFGREGRFTLKLDADVLNLFNEYNITNLGLNPSGQGGNIINTQNFNPLDSRFHLVSAAQQTACNANPTTSQQCLLNAAYQTFQLHGAPELVAAAQGSVGHNPFYNLPSAWQAKRQIRYGIRLIF